MGLLSQTGETYYGDANNYGSYQFISLSDIVTNFMIAYVGENKIISKIKKADVLFHAKRGIQELNFDTLPSTKELEIDLPASLAFTLPQDYVNYVNISFVDEDGRQQIIYPTRHTSNPLAPNQNADGTYQFSANEISFKTNSQSLDKFKTATDDAQVSDEDEDDSDIFDLYRYGNRYGINPETAQTHGVFYIDQAAGVIRFSSNLSEKTIVLKYISDGLGLHSPAQTANVQVHKFAEEALYKHIAYAILSTRSNTRGDLIGLYKKEARAAKRNAKLRLSNIKIRELAQVMRNQAKWIKH
jgi:hypothetical protein